MYLFIRFLLIFDLNPYFTIIFWILENLFNKQIFLKKSQKEKAKKLWREFE